MEPKSIAHSSFSTEMRILTKLYPDNNVFAFCRKFTDLVNADCKSKKIIGEIIYLSDRIGDLVNSILNPYNFNHSVLFADTLFNGAINERIHHLQNHADLYEKSKINSRELFLKKQIPLEIFKIIFTTCDEINFSIVSVVNNRFSREKSLIQNPKTRNCLLSFFTKFQEPEIQKSCDEIFINISPSLQKHPLITLIRLQLGLSYDCYVSSTMIKCALLTALSSHLLEGPFAHFFLSQFEKLTGQEKTTHFKMVLKDFVEFITSSLKQPMNNLLDSCDTDDNEFDAFENKQLQLSFDGMIGDTGIYLWEDPNILSACNFFKLTNPKQIIQQQFLININPERKKNCWVKISTIYQFLNLCSEIEDNHLCKLIFRSETKNLLFLLFKNYYTKKHSYSGHLGRQYKRLIY